MNKKYFELGYEINQLNKLVLSGDCFSSNFICYIPNDLGENIKCLELVGNYDYDININGKKS